MGETVDEADPNAVRVLNADFECSADGRRAYYRQTVSADADPRTVGPDSDATHCTETSISFAE